MGCGSSKGTALVIVEPIKHQVHGTHPNTERIKADNASGNYGALPPPRPPKSTKEDLLRGKHDIMMAMDQQALKADSEAGESSSLAGFTVHRLLATSVQESQNSEVVYNTSSETIARKPMAVGVVSKGDVQRHIEQFGQQQERDGEVMMEHKRRQQAILEQKLEERRNRKKQSEAAATVSGEAPTQVNRTPSPTPFVVDAVLDEAPKPVAPTTKKDVLYSEDNIALFRDLESYAVNMDKTYVTFATLMEDLFISDLSDLEKVRIIFHWITAQNLNIIDFPNDLSDDSPLGYLKAIKDKEKTYASLFLRLCSAAGLHARLIQGHLKGVGYRPDNKVEGNSDFRGIWNAVLIDGQWRLIDTHWGARYVKGDDFVEAIETLPTEHKYEEHYFLTDPDMLINTHYPDEPAWQLLSSSVTLEQYEKFVRHWPIFYKLKLAHSSHPSGLIKANEHGFVQIKLKVPPFARSDAKFKAELRPYNRQQNHNNISEMQKCILHYSTEDEEIFDVYLPRADNFLLRIYGKSKTFCDDNLFTYLCLYQW